MSAPEDLPSPAETIAPLGLRREALLPNERGRGLGTVAVVCTMAGVASGLALATTLMAMQVADTMSTRNCPYQVEVTPVVQQQTDHGFLGIRYVFQDGGARIDSVIPGTPAEAISLQPGDKVLAIDGLQIQSATELQERIYGSNPGTTPTLTIRRRDGQMQTMRPTLSAWPTPQY